MKLKRKISGVSLGLASVLASQILNPMHASSTTLDTSFDTSFEESWSVSLIEYLLDKRASFEKRDAGSLTGIGLINEEELAVGKAETSRMLIEQYIDLSGSFKEDAADELAFLQESLSCVEKITVPSINETLCMMQRHGFGSSKQIKEQTLLGTIINLSEIITPEISGQLISAAEQNEAAIINSSGPYDENLFANLQVQEWEVRIVKKIVNTLGEKNEIQLLFKKKEMKKLGSKIYHVHPLKFLEAVFTDGKTTHSMRDVEKNYFKWEGFMDGFSEKINKELSTGNLLQYLPGFAARLSLDHNKLREYAVNRDWKRFVKYLIHRS